MKLIVFFLTLFSFQFLTAQQNEIERLLLIENKYEDFLLNYQKKAKDSLSFLPKTEREVIMFTQEQEIIKRQKREEDEILAKLKLLESTIKSKDFGPCPNLSTNTPSFGKRKKKFKATEDPFEKSNKQSKSTLVTFVIDAEGNVSQVSAEGDNAEFNREIVLTMYKNGKLQPHCNNGIARKTRFSLPVKYKP